MTVKEIVRLWYGTQMGNINQCRENQLEFSEIMWKLYDDPNNIEDECWLCDACFLCRTSPCICKETK